MVNSRTRLLTNCWPWSFQKIGPDSVLSRIYCLGEKSLAAEGHELPRGIRRHGSPESFGNEYELRCNLVYFQTRLCSSTGNTYCICPHLVASGWFFFRYSYLYTVMITISLGGSWTSFFGGGGSFYPSNTPDRTLPDLFNGQIPRRETNIHSGFRTCCPLTQLNSHVFASLKIIVETELQSLIIKISTMMKKLPFFSLLKSVIGKLKILLTMINYTCFYTLNFIIVHIIKYHGKLSNDFN